MRLAWSRLWSGSNGGVTNGLCEHSRACRALRFFCEHEQTKIIALGACEQRKNLGSTSKRAVVYFLGANVKFCEQLKILMDHTSP